mgnify:CR=1 FL=1
MIFRKKKFDFLDKNWTFNIVCWCYLWFLVQFSKSACNNLERSEIIWKVREKIQKPLGNGFIDSSASYFASEHKKYTTSLMVYIGLGFKTRQRRQTVRKQWFCLWSRPLNSNPKTIDVKILKTIRIFFRNGWWDGFWLIISIDDFAANQF